jgi:hypothetical protein
MGRRKLSEMDKGFIETLIEAYMETGSQEKAAEIAGCSVRTARTYLHQEGIWPKRGRQKGRFYPKVYKGKFVKWLRAHSDVDISQMSPPQVAEISDCSAKEIREYYYRLERALGREIAQLPDLKSLPGGLRSTTGFLIPFGAWDRYTIQTKGYRRAIYINVTLKNGLPTLFYVHLDALWSIIEKRTLPADRTHHQTD